MRVLAPCLDVMLLKEQVLLKLETVQLIGYPFRSSSNRLLIGYRLFPSGVLYHIGTSQIIVGDTAVTRHFVCIKQ